MRHLRQLIMLCAILTLFTVSAHAYEPDISQGQENIVKRARQLHEIKWTPLQDVYQWDYAGVFKSGVTYSGIPYGQPVSNGGFIGWNIGLDGFLTSVTDNTSKFYSGYSWYNKIAPYYSSDCSGFVSYAWQTKQRFTTATLPSFAQKVSDQNVNAMQVGDALNKSTSHVVLISAIDLDENDSVVGVEVMEQTPVITAKTRYGTLGESSIAAFVSRYFDHGYVLYRNPNRDSVIYTHSCAVPIDGDYCVSCPEPTPISSIQITSTGRRLTLKSTNADAAIYYTTDGTTPTKSSKKYTEPIDFSKTVIVKAIAISGKFETSRVLTCRVSIDPASPPVGVITDGLENGNHISSGSKLKLSSSTSGATVYYTTDGSTPSTNSKKYTDPITINTDVTIKAIAVCSGYSLSDVSSFPFEVEDIFTVSVSATSGGTVSPKGKTSLLGGSSFVLKITPDSGCEIKSVIVNGVDVGPQKEYRITDISENYTVSVVFKDNTALPFTDVATDSWYRPAVSFAYKHKLFNGTSSSAFSPETEMTRGMFVTVLGRLAGVTSDFSGNVGVINGTEVRLRSQPSTTSDILGYFDIYTPLSVIGSDGEWYKVSLQGKTGWIRGDLLRVYDWRITNLAEGQYYTNYVKWACVMGIAGTAGGDFCANDSIIRQDMAVMLYNYAKALGYALASSSSGSFTDDELISDYASEAVYALQSAGVISGMGDGSFNPLGTATRAQVAQIFLNYNDKVVG